MEVTKFLGGKSLAGPTFRMLSAAQPRRPKRGHWRENTLLIAHCSLLIPRPFDAHEPTMKNEQCAMSNVQCAQRRQGHGLCKRKKRAAFVARGKRTTD